MLRREHKQHLERFRISNATLRAAGIDSVSDSAARELLGIHGHAEDDMSGILFPYVSPVSGERKGARIKLDKPTIDGAKYYSEQGCRHFFFPPFMKDKIEDKSAPVVIVEAEKSALALAEWAVRQDKKMLTVAIGGCWGWKRKDGKVLKPSGGSESRSGPSPDFDLMKLDNRNVALAFDSNASTHKGVQAARSALASEMIRRGANVLIADVREDVNGPDDLLAEFGDEAVKKLFDEAKKYRATVALLADMPEAVLDGRLGELCQKVMLYGGRFPVAYAWPALVTVASAMMPRRDEKQRMNLYTALSGPVHSGKTQAIEAAQQLLRIEPPALMSIMAGSAESLMRYIGDANGAPRLFSPDELAHTLEKASIQNASFASVLSRAFYSTKFTLLLKEKARAEFNASLSILGGIVDDRFEELFSHSTTAGLYDRFLFGACPGGFEFDYYPFEEAKQEFTAEIVFVAPEVWTEKSLWQRQNQKMNQRVIEIALRVAVVCASFSGRTLLTVKDLGPALALAEYGQRIRNVLKPNDGENLEAKIALKIQSYLEPYNGDFVSRRKLLNDTGAYRFGPSTAMRALKVMAANGDIEMTDKRPFMIRKMNMNGDGE